MKLFFTSFWLLKNYEADQIQSDPSYTSCLKENIVNILYLTLYLPASPPNNASTGFHDPIAIIDMNHLGLQLIIIIDCFLF